MFILSPNKHEYTQKRQLHPPLLHSSSSLPSTIKHELSPGIIEYNVSRGVLVKHTL